MSKFSEFKKAAFDGNWVTATKKVDLYMMDIADVGDEGITTEILMEEFPCNAFLAIDNVFLEASVGQFGYSVQLSISDAATKEELAEQKPYDILHEKVGWGDLSHSEFYEMEDEDFSPEMVPSGYLPLWGKHRSPESKFNWAPLAKLRSCKEQ